MTKYSSVLVVLFGLLWACGESLPERNSGKGYDNGVLARVNMATPPGDPAAVFDPAQLADANMVMGGLLYESWWKASFAGPTAPPFDASHPLWPSTNPMLGQETFRCSSCHGWDYLGNEGVFSSTTDPFYTGIPGVVNGAKTYKYTTDAEIWTFLHDGDAANNLAEHAFGNELADHDIYSLTLFIMTMRDEFAVQKSPSNFISADKNASGDVMNGSYLFRTPALPGLNGAGCASFNCHGSSGRNFPLLRSIDFLAKTNPWEFLHKIRFGVAGSFMVGIQALGNPDMGIAQGADILTFAQIALAPNYVRGGRLFDNWPVESGTPDVGVANPLWDLADPVLTGGVVPTGAEAWRCVNCHGYDYEGEIAFWYSDLVFLKSMRNWNNEYVFRQLRDGFPALMPDGSVQIVHNFGAHLTEPDLWELAAFAVEGVVDTTRYLHPDLGTATGDAFRPADAAHGQSVYEGTISVNYQGTPFDCKGCHDPVAGTVAGVDIALQSWDTPWRSLHRIRFGMPRDPNSAADVPFMPGVLELLDSNNQFMGNHDAVDVQRFLQQLSLP
ncbi:MAG: cytochrome c [Gammaproteobacteria bacterium]|nr:cytochrome c [Gammaproteobacteria bacterium]